MIKQLVKQVTARVLVIAALFLVSLLIFAVIAREAVLEHEDVFDRMVDAFLTRHSSPSLIRAMQAFTFLGSIYFLLPSYIVLAGYFFFKRKVRYGINIAIIGLSSFLAMQGLKMVFHRKRPELPIIKGITSYSFPSGHSLSSFIFCSILSYLIWKGNLRTMWKLLLIALLLLTAVTIGISRIVLHVHYATDVIAGFCLAVMWVILSFRLLKMKKSGTDNAGLN